jgi:hypothetical protein
MCPACIGNAAWIVAGAFSAGGAGGWTAFVLRRPRERAALGRSRGSSRQERSFDNQAAAPTSGECRDWRQSEPRPPVAALTARRNHE